MLTLDTSGLVALFSRSDTFHQQAVAAAREFGPRLIVPASILTEVMYVLGQRVGNRAIFTVLQDLETGAYTVDCGDRDFPRIRGLMQRYHDLPLDFADAAVISCAERTGGRVLTLDRRHFDVVTRGEGTITVLPQWDAE